VVLTPRVPKLTGEVLVPTFTDLLSSLPPLPADYRAAADFDWAMHPGGATILSGAERVMGITPEHMRASYDTYINHGNSSSATIFSVLDRLRSKDMDTLAPGGRVKDYVVGCAFGPGITVEMCMLRRNLAAAGFTGLQTPPETESEASPSEVGDDTDVRAEGESNAVAAVGLEGGVASGDNFVREALENLDLD
jgi:fungal type III polyketide synthase